jgi:hypothetical protein
MMVLLVALAGFTVPPKAKPPISPYPFTPVMDSTATNLPVVLPGEFPVSQAESTKIAAIKPHTITDFVFMVFSFWLVIYGYAIQSPHYGWHFSKKTKKRQNAGRGNITTAGMVGIIV